MFIQHENHLEFFYEGLQHIVIGDIHGRKDWIKIVSLYPNADKIIFVGDYLDSRDISVIKQVNNFRDILAFKLRNIEKVVLLLGNHDLHYLYSDEQFGCDGFKVTTHLKTHYKFQKYQSLFTVAFQVGNILITHAGVTKQWFETNRMKTPTNYADYFNGMFRAFHINSNSRYNPLFHVGRARRGSHAFGGPIWACRKESWNEFIPGIHQIVGHTPSDEIIRNENTKENSSITYIDVL